ncbi:MAG: N-acetylmuramoyl-L-alanine amidase [Corynebacterium sp.]|nr:N-acetylmuramoyl-L-alanine amidase [Corynebacterium sp.]
MLQRRRLVPTRKAWACPVTAVLAATAVATAAAFGGNQILNTQDAGSGPIEATSNSASFDDGATVVVDDPAIAAQGDGTGPRAVKEFRQDEKFSQFAVTWEGDKDLAAFVRAEQADGTWSEWYDLEPMGIESTGVNGTDLIYVGETNAVQVSLGNVDLGTPTDAEVAAELGEAPATDPLAQLTPQLSDLAGAVSEAISPATAPEAADDTAADTANVLDNAVAPLPTNVGDIAPVAKVSTVKDIKQVADVIELPADRNEAVPSGVNASDLSAVFIDGKPEAGGGITNTQLTNGMPPVVSRAGWGAKESQRCSSPTYDSAVRALTLHHTAGSNNYQQKDAIAQVRGIYQYHAATLGWCDIGYNVLVDKFGTIYEGRFGGLDRAVQGAHVGGFNSGTWGISMMGNYETAQPSQAMLNSVTSIAAWKAAISGFDPAGHANLTSGGFKGSRFAAGTVANVPAFHGHADLHFTQCPGKYTISRWPEIRNATKQKYDQIVAGNPGITQRPSQPRTLEAPVAPAPAPGPTRTIPADTTAGDPLVLSSEQGDATSSNASQLGTILSVAAAIAGLAITAGAVTVPERGTELAPGVPVESIPTIASQIANLMGDPAATESVNATINAFAPVLGAPIGGPEADAAGIVHQLFTNGAVISSNKGTYALIGEIARAWASGDNAVKLGLPTSNQYAVDKAAQVTGGQQIRVDFQAGYITFDPTTSMLHVYTN